MQVTNWILDDKIPVLETELETYFEKKMLWTKIKHEDL